jgi:hypothetical protein
MSIARTSSWILVGSLMASVVACSGSVVSSNNDDASTDTGTTSNDTGTTNDSSSPSDTGATPTDTGTTTTDSGPKDTGPIPDFGSLLDADIPDVVIGDGQTASGCYSCLVDKCNAQMTACNNDPKCATFILCSIDTCGASATNTTCILGCAKTAGIGITDTKTFGEGQAILTCAGASCPAACPSAPALPDAATGG